MAIEQRSESGDGGERYSARSLSAQRWRQMRSEVAEGGDGLDRSASLEGFFENLDEQRLARFLGWFSIGLGVTEIAAPRRLAKILGVNDRFSGCARSRAASASSRGRGRRAGCGRGWAAI